MTLLEVVRAVAEAVGLSRPRREVSWAGESVVDTKPAEHVQFGDIVGGESVWFSFSGLLPILALDDRGGYLRIQDESNGGWVLKADFMPAVEAPAYFRRRVKSDPEDFWAHGTLALMLFQAGKYREAIRGYDEYVRRDATLPGMFVNRGHCYFGTGEYDRAIRDYDEPIRLDPASAQAFLARGNAWARKHDFDKGCWDYDEAERLDPVAAGAFFKRVVPGALTLGSDALRLLQTTIGREGYECASSVYAVILGYFAAGQAGDAPAAKRFLTESAGKLDAAWPEPVVRFLRGQLDEPALLQPATDDDRRTEARCYLGLHHALKGRRAEALTHFCWVKGHGDEDSVEYTIAIAELDRLDAAKP